MIKNKQRTRRQIIDILKTNGPADALYLAAHLGLTGMAIRQHLYALQEDGLVAFDETPRPVGRPAKVWRLTRTADPLFPDSHAELTVGLIETMKSVLGESGFETVLKARSAEQIASYTSALARPSSLQAKAKKFAKIRSGEGYMAETRKDDDGNLLLVENHCPICIAATACSGLCQMELDVFQAVFGPDTTVERVDHILAGARRCAYRIIAA